MNLRDDMGEVRTAILLLIEELRLRVALLKIRRDINQCQCSMNATLAKSVIGLNQYFIYHYTKKVKKERDWSRRRQ